MARSGRRSAVRRRKSGSSNGQRELWSEGVRLSRSARAHASSSCWFPSRRGKPACAARFASWAAVQPSTPRAPGARRADRIRWPEGFFFKAETVSDEPMGERGRIGFHPARRQKLRRQLRHGDVVLLGDPAQDEDAVRVEFAVPPAAERFGRDAAALAKALIKLITNDGDTLKWAAAARR